MPIFVVIDGLSRSGTTLLSAILNTQDRMACYRGIFVEGISFHIAKWSNRLAQAEIIPENHPIEVINENYEGQSFWNGCGPLKFYWKGHIEHTLRIVRKKRLFDKISLCKWNHLLKGFPNEFSEIDQLYQNVAESINVDLLGFRWNQCISTLPIWKKRPHHKWVCVIRNPMDRALSVKTIWPKISDVENFLTFEQYVKKITALEDQIDAIVYYEDIVREPEKTVRSMLNKIGFDPPFVEIENLIGQNGLPYRNERANLVDVDGTHKIGEVYSGIYKDSINYYKSSMNHDLIMKYKSVMERFPLYHRYI